MQNLKLGGLEKAAHILTDVLYTKDKNGQSIKLPFSLSYRLIKLLESMQKEITYFSSEKQKLAQAYAQRDKDGNLITTVQEDGSYTIDLQPDKISDFEIEFHELYEVEIELDCQAVCELFGILLEKDIECDIESVLVLLQFISPDNTEKE